MPPAGTLALSDFLNAAAGSSSRKRSHAEITRSESRSPSPDHLPSKRRRISPATILNSNPSPPPTRHTSPDPFEPTVPRYAGDGYDYRRPVMATRSRRTTATPAPNDIVDLTADDSDVSTASEDSPPPSPRISRSASRHLSRPQRVAAWRQSATADQRRNELEQMIASSSTRRQHAEAEETRRRRDTESQQRQERRQESQPRAPPFGRRGPEHSVIVLSDEDESDFEIDSFASDLETTDSDSIASIASPEVQFIEERRIPQPQRPQAEIAQDVAQVGRGPFGVRFPEIIRRGQQFVFGIAPPARDYHEEILDRLDGVQRRNPGNEAGPMNVTMNYERAAFAMGFDPFDRSSETPQVVQEPYKAPPAAAEGFTRTFGEEDIILCPMCGDELAIGKGDVKQQVWVVKGCGHVYCGECTTNRSKAKAAKKGKGKEKETKLESARSQPFKECPVEGCNTKVVAKGTMFPIYL
ncbi:hypothetical protein H2200_003497 [Cladophialophora chaetospira]|uniref:Uncharacterized protein n=1 Tax=Cladophialophora chaetospira TaxID=386627 RepID=A0AA38XHG6_9EURO|nr:hypothetical protein H2200_003497 [Cladophialophora chaetospira]